MGQFEKAHGVKLGFMSFFVKAATEALKRFPAVNASLDGNDMVYHGYQDVGVAVSTEVVWLYLSCAILTAWVWLKSKAPSVISLSAAVTASWASKTCRAVPLLSPTVVFSVP